MTTRNELLYFKDLQRHTTLDEKEEQQLVIRVKNSDTEAVKELITANLRFVVSVARRYIGRGLSLMELVNEGNLGLFRAAKRFEPSRDVKFISYAVWWIRQSIQQALFDQVFTIKIPPNKISLVSKFKKALEKNKRDFNKTIEMPEFRQYKIEIVEILNKLSTVSLDSPIGVNEENSGVHTLLDMIGKGPDQDMETERRELSEIVDKILKQMTDREEKILRMYYGLDHSHEYTLDEIGKELNLTRERVRQIKTKALRKLMRSHRYKNQLYPFA